MKAMCEQCPHKEHFSPEMGVKDQPEFLTKVGSVHPCHMKLAQPCVGHIEDLTIRSGGVLLTPPNSNKPEMRKHVNPSSYAYLGDK